jgi:hypothetical protein
MFMGVHKYGEKLDSGLYNIIDKNLSWWGGGGSHYLTSGFQVNFVVPQVSLS